MPLPANQEGKSMAEDAKSNYVGVRLSNEEMNMLERVMDALEPLTGKRSQSDAVRYMIRNFNFEASPLGKELALVA
jgi:hypothetical protein